MTAKLKISDTLSLPADLGDRKIAVLAQSKAGKTYGLGDILEELYLAQRPFIAIDPANNLWGLRAKPDGTPSDFDVVVIGGDHADIPLEKDAGERIAEALLADPVCAVIDVSFESKNVTRKFVTDCCNRLMQTRSDIPRVVVLEEAPDFIPQKAYFPGVQVCKAAVERIVRVGGNFGYGAIIASQRSATIDKDVLSQCEALIVMRITDVRDRGAIRDWIQAKDIDDQVHECFEKLADLKDGEAWLWWPTENRFERFQFRKRQTLHPREMRKLGLSAGDVRLGDARRFVEKVRKELSKAQVTVPPLGKRLTVGQSMRVGEAAGAIAETSARMLDEKQKEVQELRDDVARLALENGKLKADLAHERQVRADAERRLEAVRIHFKPQYDTMISLFETVAPAGNGAAAAIDRAIYEPWLAKAGKAGCRRLLEVLLERPELTRNQLGTLGGISAGTGTFRGYISWLHRNGLIEKDGELIRLKAV